MQPRLFEKHASKLVTNIRNATKPVNDVGFFVRCNTRLIGKAETWRDTDWAKEERLQELAEPMGGSVDIQGGIMVMGAPNGTPIVQGLDN